MARKKQSETYLYDFFKTKEVLRYVGRETTAPALARDRGIFRTLGKPYGSKKDPLCKLHYQNLLTGEALTEALAICEPKPEDWEPADRFVKGPGERDGYEA